MKIDLTIKNYRCFTDANPVRLTIEPGMTAFVGANNAGKSALLRFFFELKVALARSIHEGRFAELLQGNPVGMNLFQELPDSREAFTDHNNRPMVIRLEPRVDTHSRQEGSLPPAGVELTIDRESCSCVMRLVVEGTVIEPGSLHVREHRVEERLEGGNRPIAALQPLQEAARILCTPLYIPSFRHILRGQGGTGQFGGPFGTKFVERWHEMQTGDNKTNNETIHKLVDNIGRVCAFGSPQIMASHSRDTLLVRADGRSRRLDELGAGITQIIYFLFELAVHKPKLVLIDEPELSLHPALQIELLSTLADYASYGVMFATHQYGLARALANQTYTVSKTTTGSVVHRYQNTPRLAELLGSMHYAGYCDVGYSKVLIIEGPTEYFLIKRLLRKLGVKDEFLLLTANGSNLKHANPDEQLGEISRICPNIYALLDSEKESESDQPSWTHGFTRACKALGIELCVTKLRAIENYFTDEAIKKAVGDEHRALEDFEAFGAKPRWSKSDNWRIADAMSADEWKATDVGRFLMQSGSDSSKT